jgi:hypothetical protein
MDTTSDKESCPVSLCVFVRRFNDQRSLQASRSYSPTRLFQKYRFDNGRDRVLFMLNIGIMALTFFYSENTNSMWLRDL